MQSFLVPLDGSDLAKEALPYAKNLASRLSGAIHLIRVVTVSRQLAAAGMAGSGGIDAMSTVDMEAIDEAIEAEVKEARSYLTELSRQLEAEGLKVQWEVRQGVAADEIIECARENGIDVIVITTHGRSGFARLVFGSVSDRVIREAGIPVMVVKGSAGETEERDTAEGEGG